MSITKHVVLIKILYSLLNIYFFRHPGTYGSFFKIISVIRVTLLSIFLFLSFYSSIFLTLDSLYFKLFHLYIHLSSFSVI